MKQRWLPGEASESLKSGAVSEGFTAIQCTPDQLVLWEARWRLCPWIMGTSRE